LMIKGLTFPSGPDHGSTGNWVVDYYWGTELYPRIFGWDVKTFTNCRFGMMGWAIMCIDYAGWQLTHNGTIADSMVVSVAIQLVYIFKFFYWETGYWSSLDIMHDRAGWYICWGCMVWLPAVYPSPAFYLVNHPIHLGTPLAAAILALGILMVWINYDSDRQRQQFRQDKGEKPIWGKAPVIIRAKYKTSNGEEKESLLLASGYWAMARHFHYIPEILASFFWCAPALNNNYAPYFYCFPYLFLLLLDRAFRDDARCRDKYGEAWKDYCKRVPYRLVPGLL